MTTALQLFSSGSTFNAYVKAVNAVPMLTDEEEQEAGRRIKADPNDAGAIDALVMSHLRVVVSQARGFEGYGIPMEDLVQEGNMGLVSAAKKFDIDHGVRFVSYAYPWIKASIYEHILNNTRSLKIATTKAHRKLFFNLRSLRAKMTSQHGRNLAMTDAQVQEVAKTLNVKPEEVREMEKRLSWNEISLNSTSFDDDSGDDASEFTERLFLGTSNDEPSTVLERLEHETLLTTGVQEALAVLTDRERKVITDRWINVDDQGAHGKTLVELGVELGVSTERARQIEQAALKKMRKALS